MSDTRRPYIKPVHDVRLMSNIYVCISGVGMDQHKIGWTHFFFLLSEKKKKELQEEQTSSSLCVSGTKLR